MGTCNHCKYGDLCIDWNGATTYWWCAATNDCVEKEIAEDETYDCDLYVEKLDDNETEECSA